MKELHVLSNPKSGVSESIKMLRTNVQFASSNKGSKSILITSSIAGEGKSFISSNLAATLAESGKKTILVDCDLRRGRVHNIFNIENRVGLSTILRENEISNASDYINKTDIKNLCVLTRGEIPVNPSELLNYKCIDMLIEVLKDKYDYIVFDGVPVTGLSDSLIMAKKVDMVALVTALKTASKDLVKNSKKSLESVDANLIGVIVNKVPKEDNVYYKYE